MSHLIREERWKVSPGAIAYFCSAMTDAVLPQETSDKDYPERRRLEVRENAIRYLNNDIAQLWPKAIRRRGEFRWDLLIDPMAKLKSRKALREQ